MEWNFKGLISRNNHWEIHAWRVLRHGDSFSKTVKVGQLSKGGRQWHPTPVLLHGKSHGWRSLEGCSPWSRWGSDTTEWLHFPLSCIGEGNDNPLQCSCLENPRDGGACWAAVYGVTQSQTRLKWLSRTIKRALLSFLRESMGGWDYHNHTMQKVMSFGEQRAFRADVVGSPTIPVTSGASSPLSQGGMQLCRA